MAAYTFLLKNNNAYSTLNGNITNGTTVVVNNASTFPSTGNFMATMWNASTYPDPSNDPNMEIVEVTNVSGTTFTILRAQEGTPVSNHSTGDTIANLFTVGQVSEIQNQLLGVYPSGVSGSVQYNNNGYFGGISNATTVDGTNIRLVNPVIIADIVDVNGNNILGISASGSAVNSLVISNAATSFSPLISASGVDTNVSINMLPQASGCVSILSAAASGFMNISSSKLESVPHPGDLEYDGNNLYITPGASGICRGAVVAPQLIISPSGYTLSSSSAQKIFGLGTNFGGGVTLNSNTTYRFNLMLQVSALSGSAGTVSLTFLYTGTLGSIAYQAITTRLAANGTAIAADMTGSNQASATVICVSSATTSAQIYVTGIIRMTSIGTVTPQLSASQSATPTIATNSFFEVYPMGSNTVSTIGAIV